MNSFYTSYYQSAFSQNNGFKVVLGGTGLGKTNGILEAVQNTPHEEVRFFYIANRLRLLKEFAHKLDKANIDSEPIYTFQKSNIDILKDIGEQEWPNLLTLPIVERQAKKSNLNIKQAQQDFKAFQKLSKHQGQELYDITSQQASSLLGFVKKILQSLSRDKAQKKSWHQLKSNPTIHKIFPYIGFQQQPKQKRIFLVSIQKAFSGFFDGEKNISLFNLKADPKLPTRNIIFLDEFDFLEAELLQQLSKDSRINKPFSFVERFYKQLTQYKLPREEFLDEDPKLKKAIKGIIDDIDTLKEKYKIPYPEVNHFLCRDAHLKSNAGVFQTRYSISSRPIFLEHPQDEQNSEKVAFYLQNPRGRKPNIYALLNVVNQATASIIRILKDKEIENPDVYEALINHCFEASDSYKRTLKGIKQHPHKRMKVRTKKQKFYREGFAYYEIVDLKYPTDKEEVELNYHTMFNTPESMILQLAENNLVFGLSATANMKRHLKNFDLPWLQQELKENYIYPSAQDKQAIQQANKQKAKERGNQVILQPIISPKVNSPKLHQIITATCEDQPEVFGKTSDQGYKYRRHRVNYFFKTLEQAVNNTQEYPGHLLFCISFKPILHFFEEVKEPEEGIYAISERENGLKHCYQIQFQGKEGIVLFFDAEQSQDLLNFEKHQEEYKQLFQENLPVLLVTTYASAGNGVNLSSHFDGQEKQDFTHIHLLDSPYYFFDNINQKEDSEQEIFQKIKSNIYSLGKLLYNKAIGEEQFSRELESIRRMSNFNKKYIEGNDARCNRIATYIQALGRIERHWIPTADQSISLAQDVYNDFEAFSKDEIGNRILQQNLPYFSNNTISLLKQLEKVAEDLDFERSEYQEEHLYTANETCKQAIQRLLADLQWVRTNGDQHPERAKKIRKEWQDLRRLAITQDFNAEHNKRLMQKYPCTFISDYYDYIQDCLHIHQDTLAIVPAELKNHEYQTWNLNYAYQRILQHQVLEGAIELSGGENGFDGTTPFLLPYFYQAILMGAIGEECVKAILKREAIPVSESNIPNSLYELIDLQITGTPWYIDAKNYGESTMKAISITDEMDPAYRPKLNSASFKQKAKRKLGILQNYSKEAKLLYINTFGNNDRPIEYYGEEFEPKNSFQEASIIIVQGMLQAEPSAENTPNYTAGFSNLIQQLHLDRRERTISRV